MKTPEWFHHIITEPDNKTVCPIRIIALTGCIQYFVHNTVMLMKHAVFDPQAYAVGLGALLAGAGVALNLKKDTPKQQ